MSLYVTRGRGYSTNMSKLLTQNSELRPLGIHNWTLPALATRIDGQTIRVCPNAGACAKFCYATTGTYKFSNVLSAHQRNLRYVLDNPNGWRAAILDELNKPRFRKPLPPHLPWLDRSHLDDRVTALLDNGAPVIRIHDSGDFFADWYLRLWCSIARERPDVIFYAYTKEVSMIRANDIPWNLLVCLSMGGRQDHLIDTREGYDRHAEVFPSLAALHEASYYSQDDHDLLCVVSPSTRVGIPANNIASIKKRMGDSTFGGAELDIRPR